MQILLLLIGLANTSAPAKISQGPAAFQWGDNLAWAEPDFSHQTWSTAQLSNLTFSQANVWVRIPVVVSPGTFEQPQALYLSGLFSAEVYWDGTRIGSKGRPGKIAADEVAGPIDAVFWLPPDLLTQGEHLVALRISAHHNLIHFQHPIHWYGIGQYRESGSYHLNYYLPALATLGLLILGLLYFASRFWIQPHDRGPLWLMLMTLSVIAALLLETWRAFDNFSYPLQFYRLGGMLFFALSFGICLILYLKSRFDLPKSLPIVWGCLVLNAMVIMLPNGFDFKILFAYLSFLSVGLAFSIQATKQPFKGAGLAICALTGMIGLLVLSQTLFLDRYLYVGFSIMLAILLMVEVRALKVLQRQKQEADLAIERLEIELLKRHIQPHFLMNTLTSLAEWMEADPKTGGAMIESLAELFRRLINLTNKRTISLGEEIALCRAHLQLMGFRNDCSFDLELEDVVLDREVPPTLFHTLLENAFSHNRYVKPGARFRLKQQDCGGQLHYVFEAPAGTNKVVPSGKEGTGTAYIKARLSEAYGKHWALASEAMSDGGLRTQITLYRGVRS